jgi:hypothetical protein
MIQDIISLAQPLLEHGADVNIKTNDGSYPLDMLHHAGLRPSITQLFLEHGAIASVNTQPEINWPPEPWPLEPEPEPERPRATSTKTSSRIISFFQK